QVFSTSQLAKKEAEKLKEQKAQFDKELDYHQFQFTELDEAGFKEAELEDLEVELKMLSNAEGIKTALAKAYFELVESEEPAVRQIKSMSSQLQQFGELHPELPEIIKRLQSSYIELQDIADEIDSVNNRIGSDAGKLEEINERLSLGYRLLKKHGVTTTNELIEIRNNLNEKLQAVLNIDEAIAGAEKKYTELVKQAESLAQKISAARTAQIKPLEENVNKMLIQVGMPNARIKVSCNRVPLNNTGFDDVVFLFDANKKDQFQPLRKVASGGELSRLMLCIKSLVAASMDMPTLIFDEIDTGISGEAAKQVGAIMKDLADARQVICITHQPQIAGKADAHYFVYKSLEKDTVTTGVRLLNTDERIVTIAKMMSGEKPTAAALENAREMVMN
ncbi:MAG TPA: hypothetical protein VM884_10380, partial [Flavisolibacter sp.]|nr:hypothetical protein [Flavisolibacter sp.]